jgi:hypothetical protein
MYFNIKNTLKNNRNRKNITRLRNVLKSIMHVEAEPAI